ncbi:MAG: XamI family restriction endonuclease [Gallionella sp.]|nr:XamI family restriction endonuclease [Gallionella sp.]
MNSHPPRWTEEELSADADISAANFRAERLSPTQAWSDHYHAARAKFETLFGELGDLDPKNFTDASLALAYKGKLGEALRYLAGPPISDDDLKVIADVSSLAPGVLSADPASLRKVFDVIERVIDPFRFPWVIAQRAPTDAEKSAALLASSVLLAAQRIATERRSEGKDEQETMVKDYLRTRGFTEVPAATINTIVKGPGPGQFSAECMLGDRKADVALRLHDTRLMAIECKVSNSATNSVKRVNNDAAVKAAHWNKEFGLSQVVPSAVLSGVFKTLNLVQAQKGGLTIFWAHDLDRLGQFIESTR